VEVVCKSWSQILLAHLGFLDRLGGIGGIHIVHLSCLCVRGQATGLICWVGVSCLSKLAGTSIVTWHSSVHAQSSRRAASNNKQTNISRYTNSTIEGGGREKKRVERSEGRSGVSETVRWCFGVCFRMNQSWRRGEEVSRERSWLLSQRTCLRESSSSRE
jgi:hypothetical protein